MMSDILLGVALGLFGCALWRFLAGLLWESRRTVVDAFLMIMVVCTGVAFLFTSAVVAHGLQGDANCDSRTTAIDALLVLQYEAALIEEPRCGPEADLNRSGTIDSVDAQGILSLSAYGITDLFEDNRPRVGG